MATFIKGDVVIIPFPFSDLSNSKKRPALILSNLQGDDLILCQITSKDIFDIYSINLTNNDFEDGMLNQESNIRLNKLFTADRRIVLYKIGKLGQSKIDEVVEKMVQIIRN